jgi:multidrug efflux pump subunit AcrB
LPTPPTYRKVNPADHPVLILGLTSDSVPLTDLDKYADLNLAQRIAAMRDVGQVAIFGQQKYAPTIMVNPEALAARGIGLDDVAGAIAGLTVAGSSERLASRGQKPKSACRTLPTTSAGW